MDFVEENESNDLVFSQNFEPFSIKGNVCFVSDYFNLHVSPTIIKKLYGYLEKLCLSDMERESGELKSNIVMYLSRASQLCDFYYKSEFSMSDMFKMQSLKPNIDTLDAASSLLKYLTVINKYVRPKCFVLLNMHLFFGSDEIEMIFNTLKYQGIYLIFLENMFSFQRLPDENVSVIDKDLCEIVAETKK